MKKLSYRSSLGILLALGLTGGVARAEQGNSTRSPSTSSSAEKQWSEPTDQQTQIKQAAQMNMTAIRVAEVAAQKGQNDQLKKYAQTLKQDHQQAQKDLQRIAQKQNVTLPSSLDAKCQEEVSRLENLSGSEFDREFAKAAVEGHAKAITKLQQQSAGASKSAQASPSNSSSSSSAGQSAVGASGQSSTGSGSSDWQQYNQRMLSKMKEHQREAREVARAVGVDQATITTLESQAREHVGSPGSNVESSRSKQSSSSKYGDNSSSATQKQDSRKD